MKKQGSAHVSLSRDAQRALLQDVTARRAIEACGVLLGTYDHAGNWSVEEILPLRNIFDSPVYFEFAPEELLVAELTYPDRIIGVYHSHPTGFARASSTDRENMQRVNQEQQIPWVWLILCGPFDESFAQRSSEHVLPRESVIAYHHYEQGLQHVELRLAGQEEGANGEISSASQETTRE